ncbi:hypothetical protein C2S52_016929 [Perilla frutescens var. hirtella]|nr:hypothetical protein C2S52_016929 [Perilla frutescens var. hirtella]
MEFENHAPNSNAPSPCVYMTAPNSPNGYSRSSSMEFYYSAPASPRRRAGCTSTFKASDDHLDEFEFETSKRFSDQLNSEASESPVGGDQGHEGRGKYRERGDSLPAMAFADELFLNGLVMPLKPPPRLHCDTEFSSFSLNSPLSSPKSPRTVCRIPFARKSSWNDDFDPFMVALEKVREEERGRNSHHRRSRSYSPFRAMSKSSSATADCHSQDLSIENSPMEPMPLPALSYSGPLDFKGSAYARWVRDQTRHGLSPKSPRGFFFRQRVRPLKTEQDGLDKPASPVGKHDEKKCGNVEATKVQKLKGLLVRYASFRRGNSESKQTNTSSETRKLSYFSRLSFKLKGNAHSNNKKKIPADAKMAVVQYKPSIAFCLGYGVGSTMKVK